MNARVEQLNDRICPQGAAQGEAWWCRRLLLSPRKDHTGGFDKSALVVEVDGDIHDLQQEEDARREKALSALGLRVVRFRNDEVVRDASRSAVVGKIRQFAFQ
jgi:hypothetical protein